jgi:hypothetical protein
MVGHAYNPSTREARASLGFCLKNTEGRKEGKKLEKNINKIDKPRLIRGKKNNYQN